MNTQITYFFIILAVILFDTFRNQMKYNHRENMKKQKKYNLIKIKLAKKNTKEMKPYNIVNKNENLISGNIHPNLFMNRTIVLHKN